jgi:hypothetical protein
MRKLFPERLRRPLKNILLMVVIYLALTGLHAMIDGRAPVPSTFVLVAFAIAALATVWLRGDPQEKRT